VGVPPSVALRARKRECRRRARRVASARAVFVCCVPTGTCFAGTRCAARAPRFSSAPAVALLVAGERRHAALHAHMPCTARGGARRGGRVFFQC
jgi:hypothetical protein